MTHFLTCKDNYCGGIEHNFSWVLFSTFFVLFFTIACFPDHGKFWSYIRFLLWIWATMSVTISCSYVKVMRLFLFELSHVPGKAMDSWWFLCCCRAVVWLAVVRPRQGRTGLGRKWQRSVFHLWGRCGQQVPQPSWSWPHYPGTPSMWPVDQLHWWQIANMIEITNQVVDA